MPIVKEYELFAKYIGKQINLQRIGIITSKNSKGSGSYSDCEEYIVDWSNYCYNETLQKELKISPKLVERWISKNINFKIYLYIKNQKLIGGHIYKYVENKKKNNIKSIGYLTDANQQELRIAENILNYIKMEENSNG